MSSDHTTLNYRRTAKRFYWLVFWLLVLGEVIIVRLNYVTIVEKSLVEGSIKLILASTVPLSIFVRLFFVVRPRLFSTYKVFEDHFLVIRGKKRQEFLYNRVEAIRVSFFSPRFFGGFKLIMKSGQKLVFLSILENNHLVLQKVVRSAPDLLSREKFEQYCNTSQLVDISWERIRDKMKKWPLILLKFIVLPVLSAALFYWLGYRIDGNMAVLDQLMYLSLVFSFVTVVLAAVVNHFEEKHLNQLVIQGGPPFKRNKIDEKNVGRLAHILFGGVYALLLGVAVSLMI